MPYKNAEDRRAHQRRWYSLSANKQKVKTWTKRYHATSEYREHHKEYMKQRGYGPYPKKYHIRRHHITEEQRNNLSIAQDNLCAICKRVPSARGLGLDHDHSCCPGPTSCGKCIRGLLCVRCNTKLGMLEGLWTILAYEYLAKYQIFGTPINA